MSSFFKGSCFICWLTWLLSLSTIIGTGRFIAHHIVQDTTMTKCLIIMVIVCYGSAVFSFIGCVFLKCDILSLYAAILYVIPVGVIIPGLCTYGIVLNHNDSAEMDINNVFNLAKQYYITNRKFPAWLTETEDEFECCGIYGPGDHRNIRRSGNYDDCINMPFDVPCSCCRGERHYHDTPISKLGYQNSEHCLDLNNFAQCGRNGSNTWMKALVTTKSYPNSTAFNIENKCSDKTNDEFMIDQIYFNSSIHSKGCYKIIKGHYDHLKLWLQISFSALIVLTSMMSMSYLNLFCSSGPLSKSKSQHSLDVEVLSFLELPVKSISMIPRQDGQSLPSLKEDAISTTSSAKAKDDVTPAPAT